jgi:hypothetical protein
MAERLPETLVRGEELEAELEELRPFARQCLNATFAMSLLTSATALLRAKVGAASAPREPVSPSPSAANPS